MNEKQTKIAIIVGAVIILATAFFFSINKNKKEEQQQQQLQEIQPKELPLRVDAVPVTFNIVNENGTNMLDCSFTNNSNVDITSFTLELNFKDTNQATSITFNNLVKAGQTSEIVKINAPASANKDDVEILKYKISTTNGVYMEYDVKLNQYNWS